VTKVSIKNKKTAILLFAVLFLASAGVGAWFSNRLSNEETFEVEILNIPFVLSLEAYPTGDIEPIDEITYDVTLKASGDTPVSYNVILWVKLSLAGIETTDFWWAFNGGTEIIADASSTTGTLYYQATPKTMGPGPSVAFYYSSFKFFASSPLGTATFTFILAEQ